MSRVEGKMSRVEIKMSRVQKCRLHSGFESLVKKPEFFGRFCIIEQFTFLYTIEYFHAVGSIPKISRHRGEEFYNAVAICPAAVSNRLKCSPNFPRKPFSNLMKLLYLCLEMSGDSKIYFGFVVDGKISRGHTMKSP